jgi:tetratricopeptide (TPR) repeat protein
LVLLVALGTGFWFWPRNPGPRERDEALELASRGDYKAAEPLLERCLLRDARDSQVLAALVKIKLADGRLQEALSKAEALCVLEPGSVAALKLRWEVRRRLEDVKNALEDGPRILELAPDDDGFRIEMAEWYRQLGHFRDAERLARSSLQHGSKEPRLFLLLAELCHSWKGDRTEAADLLDKLAAEQPLSPRAQLLRGILYEEAGQPDRALPLLREAAAQLSEDKEALYHLSVVLERTGTVSNLKEANELRARLRRLGEGLPWFEEVTATSGINFQHINGATPINYIQESLGSGIAWIDYNNDGWPDLFCVQGGPVRPSAANGVPVVGASTVGLMSGGTLGGRTLETCAALFPGRTLPTHKLYRNNGDGTFTDVTEQVGLNHSCYGMGCAVGDYDNDGYDDLVVTSMSGITLYHNESDGHGGRRFVDVTAKAGLNDPSFATSCAWGDIDGDGFLDLYVCNYVRVNMDDYPTCRDQATGRRLVCEPRGFPAVAHQLFRNNGNGTFTDISVRSGIASVVPARGLVVVIVDLDGDGRPDIYVGNDADAAFLFHNEGEGHFTETAVASGCAFGPVGEFVAAMGVDAADLDGSGRPSLFITNFQDRPNILFQNLGDLLFQDMNRESGLGPASLNRLAFGTVAFDANLDGRLDIAIANGHIDEAMEEVLGVQYAQEAQLFLGDGRGHFRDVSADAGSYFRQRRVGRGLACADFDNDGKPDLAFSNNGGSLALLRNLTNTSNNWIRLELIGDGNKSNRNAIGARIEIECAATGGAGVPAVTRQVRFINGGGSYLSASERRQLVGLGSATRVDRVTVLWPSGRKQVFQNLHAGSWFRLYEGREAPIRVEVKGPGLAVREQAP